MSHPDASIGMILEAQAQAQRRLLLDDQRSLDPMAAFEVNSRRTTQEMEQVERFNADPSWRRGRIRDVVAAREVAIEINSTLWRGLSARATELEDAFGDPEAARRAFDSMPSFDVSVSLKTAYHRDPSHRWKPNDIQDIDALSSTVPYCDIVVTDKEAASHLVQTGVSDRLQTIVLSNLADLARHVYGRDDRSAVYTPVDVRR